MDVKIHVLAFDTRISIPDGVSYEDYENTTEGINDIIDQIRDSINDSGADWYKIEED